MGLTIYEKYFKTIYEKKLPNRTKNSTNMTVAPVKAGMQDGSHNLWEVFQNYLCEKTAQLQPKIVQIWQ